MLHRLPRQLPSLSAMLDDLANPPARAVARALGVTERTLRRWRADDQAPRAVMLALYWLTRWGQSEAHTEAHNAAVLHAGYARALRDEVARLSAELARVLALRDCGAANAPSLAVRPLAQVLPFRCRARSHHPTGA